MDFPSVLHTSYKGFYIFLDDSNLNKVLKIKTYLSSTGQELKNCLILETKSDFSEHVELHIKMTLLKNIDISISWRNFIINLKILDENDNVIFSKDNIKIRARNEKRKKIKKEGPKENVEMIIKNKFIEKKKNFFNNKCIDNNIINNIKLIEQKKVNFEKKRLEKKRKLHNTIKFDENKDNISSIKMLNLSDTTYETPDYFLNRGFENLIEYD